MMDVIRSLQNPRVKAAAKLRQRKSRDAAEQILVDGRRELRRAIEAGISVVEVFHCPDTIPASALADLLRGIPKPPQQTAVAQGVFEKLAYGERNDGVVAVVSPPSTQLAILPRGPRPLFAVLDEMEKPGNIGAIARSAHAAGLSGLILADPRTDPFNPNAIRSSLGTIFSLPLAADKKQNVIGWLRANGIKIFTARVDGASDYTRANFTQPAAIVLGSEAHGLSEAWRDAAIQEVRIPMAIGADSLNVSTTGAILFFEAIRQRLSAANLSL